MTEETLLQNVLTSLGADDHDKEIKADGIPQRINEAISQDKPTMLRHAKAMYVDKMKNFKEFFNSHYEPVENKDDRFTNFPYQVDEDTFHPVGTSIPMAVRVFERSGAFYVQFRMEFEHV